MDLNPTESFPMVTRPLCTNVQ